MVEPTGVRRTFESGERPRAFAGGSDEVGQAQWCGPGSAGASRPANIRVACVKQCVLDGRECPLHGVRIDTGCLGIGHAHQVPRCSPM